MPTRRHHLGHCHGNLSARPRGAVIIAALVIAVTAAGAAFQNALATCLPVAQAPMGGIRPVGFTADPRAAPVPPYASPVSAAYRWQLAQDRRGAPPPQGVVGLRYLGHSSFLITTPGNVTAITDYNGYLRAAFTPDIVTMNHAHESHYTDFVEPGVKHILRGWTGPHGYPRYDLRLRDMRVRNVATNIRGIEGGTEIAGNSIFIFETNGLCIVHLGHLHHLLTKSHLGRIGAVDVLLAPIDDGMTITHANLLSVIGQLNPRVVVPMHVFDDVLLDRFSDLIGKRGYVTRRHNGPGIALSQRTLPRRTVLVLTSTVF